ncbi:hypothetical protein B0T25DRAFT_613897 [Lasiosphaeria hispida]|uniref:GST C-terminal domain-containing protein n=1 Tax=Lasiosphaeria hispida TaxID=260671 RepID=A0AAJ0HCY4_9PEZI|nr:hypothetical protein B0T25DRAFT_613897 [Lasiosphaeria hispida]
MTFFGTIYSYPDLPCPAGVFTLPLFVLHDPFSSYNANQIPIVAAINDLEIVQDPAFELGVTNRAPEYRARFPLGKVPGFTSADDTLHLAGGQAIRRHVAASGPRADPATRARNDEWSCYADNEPTVTALPAGLMTALKVWPYNAARHADLARNFKRPLGKPEVGLRASGGFLFGEELTMADVMVAGPLVLAGSFLMDEMRKAAPSVAGFLEGLMEIPVVGKAFGGLKLCQTRAAE